MPDLELLDCGGGRRLERFGPVVVDRPAPAADWIPRLPRAAWTDAGLRWERGGWVRPGALRGTPIDPWTVRSGGLTMECRPAAGGQLGVFPEHAPTWEWLDRVVHAAADSLARPPEVLSLFAYTGGATLACARAGARVVHVDASRPAVSWARRNAELSGLGEAPVRWIVEDARAFVRRERRRGRRYDGVVLDPPSYGHGTGAWQIEEHLRPLLEDLAAIAGPKPSFVLLSAHTQGFDGDHLAALAREHFGVSAVGDALITESRAGSRLPLGAWARAPSARPDARAPDRMPLPHHSEPISSARNPRVRAAADLRERRARDAAGLTLVDGARELARALEGGAAVVEVFADLDRLAPEGAAAVDRAAAAGAVIVPVTGRVLDGLAYGDRAEGIVATVRIPDLAPAAIRLPADPLVVVLEGVEKPGNLGAVLRSADGAGADAVIAADPRTDLFNPNAVRASVGTIFSVPVAAGPSPEVRDHLLAASVRLVAARTDAEADYAGIDLTGPVAIVLGSEADGLSDAWRHPSVLPVRLPMLGVADSLNVSIAAAVLLYEARRQRGIDRPRP